MENESKSSSIIDVEEIEGIGYTTARKLKSVGITNVFELACSNPSELAIDLKCTFETASTHIENARKLLRQKNIIGEMMQKASDIEKNRLNLDRISTGSTVLDNLLGGGIETKAITEFYGEFGSGKSQICHTLAVMSISKYSSPVIYLDTEGTFRPERIRNIAESRSLEPLEILDKIFSTRIYSASQLEILIKELPSLVSKTGCKLVIIDSIINQHRSEFLGRGTLAERQQRLSNIMHTAIKIAEIYNIAIVITNQVHHSVDFNFGDPTRPAGGNIIGHASTYRLYLRKSSDSRIVRMVDSPSHAYSECKICITQKGIDDIEEELERLKKLSR